MSLDELNGRLREFANARDWQQFHNPKNLVMALTGEAGELAELFQWLTPDEAANVMRTPDSAEKVRHEIADVLAYLLRLADVLDVDVSAALTEKIQLNEAKYPVRLAKGSARKYDELGTDEST